MVLGWAVGALVFSLWTWAHLWGLTPGEAAALARKEDPGRGVVDIVLLAHTLLSYLFGAVILAATINLVVGLGS